MKKVKWKKAYSVSILNDISEIQYRELNDTEPGTGSPLIYVKFSDGEEIICSNAWLHSYSYNTKKAAREELLQTLEVKQKIRSKELLDLEMRLHIARACLDELVQKEKEIRRALR